MSKTLSSVRFFCKFNNFTTESILLKYSSVKFVKIYKIYFYGISLLINYGKTLFSVDIIRQKCNEIS